MAFRHKLYTIQGQYIRTLSETNVFSRVNIDASIDSGIATYTFSFNKEYDAPLAANEFLLLVYEYTPTNKDGYLLFAGTLDSIGGKLANDENIIEYRFGGLHRLLNQIQYNIGSYTGQKVKDLVQNVVNAFNANYPLLSGVLGGYLIKNGITDETQITKTSATTGTCLTALQDIMKLAGQHFFVKADGTIIGGPKATTAKHRFNVKKDITNLEVDRVNILDVCNSVIVNGVAYENTASILLYGKRQKVETLQTTDITTITNFTNNYLAENANGKREISLQIKKKDYSNIYPGDTITILNTRLENLNNLQIQKTTYDGQVMTIYLEKYKSLPQLLKN